MDISIGWLNAYFAPDDAPISADEAGPLLTELGFPVEGVTELPGGDICIDFELTSNRGDCACHVGFAREVAAATGRTLTLPDVPEQTGTTPAHELATIQIDDPDGCPRYTGWIIRGAKIGPSPDWLTQRLESIGQRPINNAVDITNFVLHELGQPTHVFDISKLAKRDGKPTIIVRRSTADEQLTTLDGNEHTLPAGILVIADADQPVALAGVMGGQATEVNGETTDILLEAATFDPLAVRITARRLKTATDSSYRFERIVEPRTIEYAARRAAHLIAELTGGTLATGFIDAGKELPEPKHATMRCARCRQLLGVDIHDERQVELLAGLELSPVFKDGVIECTIPAHRTDLSREADLIEEVARTYGYSAIPIHDRLEVIVHSPQPSEQAKERVRAILTGLGYYETITFSFVSKKDATPFLPHGAKLLKVEDERRKAEPYLRPSILPRLLHCRKSNQDAGVRDVKLFELSATFARINGELDEHHRVAMVCDAPNKQAGLRMMRMTVAALVRELCGTGAEPRIDHAAPDVVAFDKEACGKIIVNGETFGWLGLADQSVTAAHDLAAPIVMAELDLDMLMASYPPAIDLKPLPQYPHIERDLSVIVVEATPWSKIQTTIAGLNVEFLEGFEYVTTFRGKQIGAGKKSITVRLRFRDEGGTLRHEQVDPQAATVVAALKDAVDAELRT
ncbi:MAG: phenylalanine--tRNA ligase subunit beta [Phycisphaerales bacterium]|nr:phenylalanine--tRNA ligase subunit beta [Phycisphaerales bacterium]